MVSLIQADRRGRSRLEIARHAEGTDAIGWVLVGFLLGAGAAILALTHADFRGARPLDADRLLHVASARAAAPPGLVPGSVHVVRAPPVPPPVGVVPPALAAPRPGPPPIAQAPRRAASPSDAAQVDEDAAATGMTSQAAHNAPDLY